MDTRDKSSPWDLSRRGDDLVFEGDIVQQGGVGFLDGISKGLGYPCIAVSTGRSCVNGDAPHSLLPAIRNVVGSGWRNEAIKVSHSWSGIIFCAW